MHSMLRLMPACAQPVRFGGRGPPSQTLPSGRGQISTGDGHDQQPQRLIDLSPPCPPQQPGPRRPCPGWGLGVAGGAMQAPASRYSRTLGSPDHTTPTFTRHKPTPDLPPHRSGHGWPHRRPQSAAVALSNNPYKIQPSPLHPHPSRGKVYVRMHPTPHPCRARPPLHRTPNPQTPTSPDLSTHIPLPHSMTDREHPRNHLHTAPHHRPLP